MAIPGGTSRARAPPGHPADGRFELLDGVLRRHHCRPDALLEILHAAQELFGHLGPDVLRYVARRLELPPSRVQGVATFYHLFRLSPRGAHSCTVCVGTACYVAGAERILRAAERACGARAGETTADGKISVGIARCIGTCGVAPAVVWDRDLAGRQTEEAVAARLRDWGAR
jgi:bidirectional [NiFe] hydrogenase diaphorase subunit